MYDYSLDSGAPNGPRTQNFFVVAKFIDSLWYAVDQRDLNDGNRFPPIRS